MTTKEMRHEIIKSAFPKPQTVENADSILP